MFILELRKMWGNFSGCFWGINAPFDSYPFKQFDWSPSLKNTFHGDVLNFQTGTYFSNPVEMEQFLQKDTWTLWPWLCSDAKNVAILA